MTPLDTLLLTPQRILMLAPHPDDESLGTGGLIQRAVASGSQVHVVFVTDGDNNPWPQRYLERRWNIGAEDRARWGARRRAEGHEALEILAPGATTHQSLGLPDAGILDLHHADAPGPRPIFEKLLGTHRPDILLLPSPNDRHTDHQGTYLYAMEAVRGSGYSGRIYSYLIHRPWLHKLIGRHSSTDALTLSPQERTTKLRAIECHQTQMALSRARFSRFASDTERYNVVVSHP